MTGNPLYLRQDVQVEPLVDQWYAWSHLIPPCTAARNATHRHFRIMDSYVNAPQVHASAVKNPKMLGGPFIDHGGRRIEEIRLLREETAARRAPLLELSAALEQLDEMLRTVPDGHSLQPLNPQVPEILAGYVELVYDLRSNASFRLDRAAPVSQPALRSVGAVADAVDHDRGRPPVRAQHAEARVPRLRALAVAVRRRTRRRLVPAQDCTAALELDHEPFRSRRQWGGSIPLVLHRRAARAVPALYGRRGAMALLRARVHPGRDEGDLDSVRSGPQLHV